MKTKKYKFLNVVEVPEVNEEGIVYVSEEYKCAIFLCPCGCGSQCVLNILNGAVPCWTIVGNSIDPSIKQRFGCESHFFIKNGNVIGA